MARRKVKTDEVNGDAKAAKAKFTLPKNCKVYKKGEAIPPIIWRVKSLPEQHLRDKIARDKCLDIGSSYTDFKNKKFVFSVIKNIDFIDLDVTFEEAAAMYGWKKFTFTMNNQTVIPEWEDHGADEQI